MPPIRASLILSRVPIVTPEVSEFDQKFYDYQESLERRLMWTFPKWYYFKKGTVAEREFTKAQKYPVAKHAGVWYPQGVPDVKHDRDRRFKQEVILPEKASEEESEDAENAARPITANPRETDVDRKNDQTSLERKLPRTLYLVVKQDGAWRFPAFKVEGEEKSLAEVAEAGIRTLGGDKINTFSVSQTPAKVIRYLDGKIVQGGDGAVREYMMKSHIVAGRFDPQGKVDYKWLDRDEVKEAVGDEYFKEVGALLARY